MTDFLHDLCSSGGFMPHGNCYLWTPGLIWLHVISDALIVLAYYSIPVTLIYFTRKRTDMQFGWMFLCFAAFILACGTTHLMEIWDIWHANYWLAGGIKAITAVTSVTTAVLLTRLVKPALALPSPAELERVNKVLAQEIQTRRQAEEDARKLNSALEQRVAERTAELNTTNADLRQQMAERQQTEIKNRDQLNELLRWQEVMLNREDRVQELKAEVDELLVRQDQPPRYGSPGKP